MTLDVVHEGGKNGRWAVDGKTRTGLQRLDEKKGRGGCALSTEPAEVTERREERRIRNGSFWGEGRSGQKPGGGLKERSLKHTSKKSMPGLRVGGGRPSLVKRRRAGGKRRGQQQRRGKEKREQRRKRKKALKKVAQQIRRRRGVGKNEKRSQQKKKQKGQKKSV